MSYQYEDVVKIAELNLLSELCKKQKRTIEEEALYRSLLKGQLEKRGIKA